MHVASPRLRRLTGPVIAVAAAAVLAGCGLSVGQSSGAPRAPGGGQPKAAQGAKRGVKTASSLPWRSTGNNPYLPDDVLIADSHNDRILLVSPQKKILWQFPKPGQRTPLYDDDDVFFGPRFDEIITNEENNNTVAILNFKSGKVVWMYGHRGQAGSAPGYLHTPDDAFLFDKNGKNLITVADIKNQRILFIDRATKKILKQYGQTGIYGWHPPTTFAAPNGDFPAPNGGMLITQIGANDAMLVNAAGKEQWTVRFPSRFSYPSDANFTPDGNVIVAFYTHPGAVVIMNPKTGKVVWQYAVTSGPGMLDQPSLAVQLKNGMVMLNDDYNDRVIVIDPKTDKIVWQYGHTATPGSAPGYLDIPDGMDILPPGVVPGGRNPIGGHMWSYPGNGL